MLYYILILNCLYKFNKIRPAVLSAPSIGGISVYASRSTIYIEKVHIHKTKTANSESISNYLSTIYYCYTNLSSNLPGHTKFNFGYCMKLQNRDFTTISVRTIVNAPWYTCRIPWYKKKTSVKDEIKNFNKKYEDRVSAQMN